MADPRLMWRPIQAPDFSSAAQLSKAASEALNRAFGSAAGLITDVQQGQQQNRDTAALMAAMKYTDPTARAAAMADGSIFGGQDPSKLSAGAINKIDAGMANSIANANSLKAFQEKTEMDGLRQQYAGDITAFNRDVASGKGVKDLVNDPRYAGLLGSKLGASVLNGSYGDSKNAFSNADMVQSAADAALKRADAENLRKVTDFILPNVYSRGTAEQAMATAQKWAQDNNVDFARIRGGVEQALADRLGSKVQTVLPDFNAPGSLSGGDIYTSGGGTGRQLSANYADSALGKYMASAAGTQGTAQGSGWDATVGNVKTPVPLTQMTMGQVQDFGKNTLIPGNKGMYGNAADRGSSASGALQITGETMEQYAPKLFGANWRQMQFTPEVQDKLGEAIFEDRKASGTLGKTWTSLQKTDPQRANTPGAYSNMSWKQVRGLIAKGEVGQDVYANLRSTTDDADQLAMADANSKLYSQARSSLLNSGFSSDFDELMKDTSGQYEVIKKLRDGGFTPKGKDGAPDPSIVGGFKAMSDTEIADQLRSIKAMIPENGKRAAGQMSDALAARILQESATASKGMLWGNNFSIDKEKVKQLVADYHNGNMAKNAAAFANANNASENLSKLRDAYITAQNEGKQILDSVRFMPINSPARVQAEQAANQRIETARQALVDANLQGKAFSESMKGFYGQEDAPEVDIDAESFKPETFKSVRTNAANLRKQAAQSQRIDQALQNFYKKNNISREEMDALSSGFQEGADGMEAFLPRPIREAAGRAIPESVKADHAKLLAMKALMDEKLRVNTARMRDQVQRTQAANSKEDDILSRYAGR